MFATPSILPRLRASGFFSEADLYQARFAAMLVPRKHQSRVAVLTALLSLAVRDGLPADYLQAALADPPEDAAAAETGQD